MKEILTEPFEPYVSEVDILDFDPEKPETYTKSPLINAVLRAVAVVGPHSPKKICDYMQVSRRLLWPAVKLITGLSQYDFRMYLVTDKIDRLVDEHPDWSADMIAHELGYSTRADIHRVLGREEYAREVSYKSKKARYYKNRKKD